MKRILLRAFGHLRYSILQYKIEFLFFFVFLPIYTILNAHFSGKFIGKVKFLDVEISYFEFFIFSWFLGMAYISFITEVSPRDLKIYPTDLLEDFLLLRYIARTFISLVRKLLRYFPYILVFSIFLGFRFFEFLILYFFSIFFSIPMGYLLLSLRLLLKKESYIVIDSLSDVFSRIFPTSFSIIAIIPKNISWILTLFPILSSFEAARAILIFGNYSKFLSILLISSLINLAYIFIFREIFRRVFYKARREGWILLD